MKVISVKTRAELNQQAENLEVEIRQLEVSYYNWRSVITDNSVPNSLLG